MPPREHQIVIERFVEACRADDRVVAAFIVGSHARGDSDEYSDLDLCLIATDAGRADLWTERRAFISQLGKLLFLEDFDGDVTAYFFLTDGTEAELSIGRESGPQELHSGPYRVLLDKKGLLDGATFPLPKVDPAEQIETTRRQIFWFWHDLSHFIAAMGRGQLWWGYGQLEILRRYCVVLARLREDFSAEPEDYDKIDLALPAGQLSALRSTYVPMEPDAMIEAALAVISFFTELAVPLAREHGITYPVELELLMRDRLDQVSMTSGTQNS